MHKRDEILKKAAELFVKDGYSGDSMRTIARAAGIVEGLYILIYSIILSKIV